MAKDVGYIKDFLEKKLKHISLKGLLIRIPVYFSLVFIVVYLLESSGLLVDIVLSDGENVTWALRIKEFVFQILFYMLIPLIVTIFLAIKRKNFKIYDYLTEVQIFIFILFIASSIINAVSLHNEDNSLFDFGTGGFLVLLSLVIEYLDFTRDNRNNELVKES